MCPLWSETATGYTVLVLKKKNKVFFSSPDYLIYTRTRRPALYVYNIIYITHASSSPPLPTSTILYLSYRYLPRTPVCRQIYFVRVYFFCILYTVLVGLAICSHTYYIPMCVRRWPPTGPVVNFIVRQVAGYRSSGLRLLRLWSVRAYAGAIIIHCRLSAATATAADYLHRIHDRRR